MRVQFAGGMSTLRDRVCMTAAMLVLEPIFEADLPPELYAYRPGRNAQQAVVAVGEMLFRGHPDVVDADLADYFGSIPHAECWVLPTLFNGNGSGGHESALSLRGA